MKSNLFKKTAITFLFVFVFLIAGNYFAHHFLLPYWPETKVGRLFQHLDFLSKSVDFKKETMIFLGSSRFHSAIRPEIIEKKLLRIDRVINHSQPSMSFWEHSKALNRINLRMLNLKFAVLEINPWTLNRVLCHPVTKEFIYHRRELASWGNIQEILKVEPVYLIPKLIFRHFIPRHSIEDYLAALKNKSRIVKGFRRPHYHRIQQAEQRRRRDPNFKAVNISQCHLLNYEFSRRKARQFLEFATNLEKNAIDVILIQLPVRRKYFDYIKSKAKLMENYNGHIKFLSNLSKKYPTLIYPTPDEMGMNNSIFIDYGHMSKKGSRRVSHFLAEKLQQILSTR